MASTSNAKSKRRLDVIVVERELAPSRTVAQAMIMAGEVRHGTTKLIKPGQLVEPDIELIMENRPRYASRGGDKLASVAEQLGLSFAGKVVLDVGSSTGGFTDYALQHGAVQVYAVDVGTAQLAYKLRGDARVVVMEQTDIRAVKPAQLSPRPDIAVIDVSFISLATILSSVAALITLGGLIIAMAKPQFEADKPTADRYKGVIKDEKVRSEILSRLEGQMKESLTIVASADSSVHGVKGNRERFYVLKRNSTTSSGRIT